MNLLQLPAEALARIIRDVVEHRAYHNILPRVSYGILRRLQGLQLSVGHVSDDQALNALTQSRFGADGKRAWSVGGLDLFGMQVTDVSALQ